MWIKTDAGTFINLDCVEVVTKSVYSDTTNTIYILSLRSGQSVTLCVPTKAMDTFETNLAGLIHNVVAFNTLINPLELDEVITVELEEYSENTEEFI